MLGKDVLLEACQLKEVKFQNVIYNIYLQNNNCIIF